MKNASGLIEILVAFLLISVIVAVGMQMSLNQMEMHQLKKESEYVENHVQAQEMIINIEDLKKKRLQYEEDIVNDYNE